MSQPKTDDGCLEGMKGDEAIFFYAKNARLPRFARNDRRGFRIF